MKATGGHKKIPGTAGKVLFVAGLVLCVLLVVVLLGRYWTFHHYKTEVTDAQENTLVYSYASYNGSILRYATDTASLSTADNETRWTITYEMNNPQIVTGQEAFAIYDKNGTSVHICNENGERSLFHTEMPIVKAGISRQGTFVALQDDGSSTQIDYFSADGSLIATIRTTLDAEGYPMDIALSADGTLLGVVYLHYDQGTYVSDVVFYSFGAAGQLSDNNIVSQYSYTGTLIPQIAFMGEDACTAFGTDKLIVYQGNRTPQELTTVEIAGEIQSSFVLKNCFGVIVQGQEQDGQEIYFYNKRGKEKASVQTDFIYTALDTGEDQLVLYNTNAMCVYNADGIQKFNGELEFFIRQICYLGANRYVLSATDSFQVIKLY